MPCSVLIAYIRTMGAKPPRLESSHLLAWNIVSLLHHRQLSSVCMTSGWLGRLGDFPCGRLSWLPVSFLLHVKYPLSYRIGRLYKLNSWTWKSSCIACGMHPTSLSSCLSQTQQPSSYTLYTNVSHTSVSLGCSSQIDRTVSCDRPTSTEDSAFDVSQKRMLLDVW